MAANVDLMYPSRQVFFCFFAMALLPPNSLPAFVVDLEHALQGVGDVDPSSPFPILDSTSSLYAWSSDTLDLSCATFRFTFLIALPWLRRLE